jgi:hypothetical protein
VCSTRIGMRQVLSKPKNIYTRGLFQAPTPSGAGPGAKTVDYVTVSEHYWPSMPRDTLAYHPQAAALLEQFQSTYADLKKPRKLQPAHTLGQVELELDFADGSSRSFAVTPLQVSSCITYLYCRLHVGYGLPWDVQANVILHFQEAADGDESASTVLSLRRLAAQCEVEEDELFASGVSYWLGKGVLREATDAAAGQTASAQDTSSYGYGGYDEGPDRLFEVVETQQAHATADMSMEGDLGMVGQQVRVVPPCECFQEF